MTLQVNLSPAIAKLLKRETTPATLFNSLMGQPCGGRVERHRVSGVETLKTALACHYPSRFTPLTIS
ncbi:hypothetical protein [uncultured Nostoc sp.]|uniref:hypothetical protein n=1 Tax=uncultured Nostoc sp. TaxID=340711 RepID=UPI0035CBC515